MTNANTNCTHLLWCGDRWVRAVRVDAPWSYEVDGDDAEGWAWKFWSSDDAIAWLAA